MTINEMIVNFPVTTAPRFFCYLWYMLDAPGEPKFGDTWVDADTLPYEKCATRVRSSMGQRKDLFDTGQVIIHAIYDVSEYARSQGKFRKHGKIDDSIRQVIGHRKSTTGDVHTLHYEVMDQKVREFLDKQNQPRPVLRLSTAQYEAVSELKEKFTTRQVIAAILAARLGKTHTASSLFVEMGYGVMVVCSYVKTALESFHNDMSNFEQFRDIVQINAEDADYMDRLSTARNNGKTVAVFLSLCPGSCRQTKVNDIFALSDSRFVVVDEADFGAWQPGQAEMLKNAVQPTDKVLLMTGTNADRASSVWDIDYMMCTTYSDLLVQKNAALKMNGTGLTNPAHLIYFDKDIHWDTMYPGFQCYQMDLNGPVNWVVSHRLIEDLDTLPSWIKFVRAPLKNKALFVRILEAMFYGKHNHPELNVDYQTGVVPERRVAMMFFSENTKVSDLRKIQQIAQSTLLNYKVTLLTGSITTQAKAEQFVKEVLYNNPDKSVLILSAKIGQRSFSIPEIDEVYLAYDHGQDGATIQKMSRSLTSNEADSMKEARIISLSFDPNRDDKFEGMLLDNALNRVTKMGRHATDINTELRRIYESFDIFSCTPNGAVKMLPDVFAKNALSKNTLSRIMGAKFDCNGLSPEHYAALIHINMNYTRSAKVEAAMTGKTYETSVVGSGFKITKSNDKKVLEAVTALYENADILMYAGTDLGATNVRECFEVFESADYMSDIELEYGIPYPTIKYLFTTGRINEDWINILHHAVTT